MLKKSIALLRPVKIIPKLTTQKRKGFLMAKLWASLLLLITLGQAQPVPVDSVQHASLNDSLPTLRQPLSPLTLNELQTFLRPEVDSLQVVTFNNLQWIGYQGLADVFRTNPQIQVLDFLEMGLPRFVSFLHLWPRQTALWKDGFPLNDPTTGRYNTRLIYPDALTLIQPAEFAGGTDSSQLVSMPALNLYSRFIVQEEPYTRIKYSEGDFNYTDLDITFARSLNPRTLLQLGGVNRDYTPTYYRGTHYRGALTHIWSKQVVGQLRYHKSSENVNFLDYYGMGYGRFRYNEVREDISSRVFLLNKAQKVRLQIDAGFQNTRRKYVFADNGQRLRVRFDRYLLSAQGDVHFFVMPIKISSLLNQVKAWGTPYLRKYTDSYGRITFQTNAHWKHNVQATAGLTLQALWGHSLQSDPFTRLTLNIGRWQVRWSAQSFARFPTLHERFFSLDSLKGDRQMAVERHFRSEWATRWAITSNQQLEVGLVVHGITNEIRFFGQRFYNATRRNFSYWWANWNWRFWHMQVKAGGQSALNGDLLGPDYSAFAHVRYSDRWYHNRVRIRLSGTIQWLGPTHKMAYQPYAESFYLAGGKWPAQWLVHYKLSATIKDAIFFMEMDNALGQQYQIIEGFPELYRRVRFGLSWVLWN